MALSPSTERGCRHSLLALRSDRAILQSGCHSDGRTQGPVYCPTDSREGLHRAGLPRPADLSSTSPAAKPTDGGAALAFPFLFRTILAAEPSPIC